MNTLDPERRQQMVEAIATWLDDLTEAEPPPAGLPPEVMGSFGTGPRPLLHAGPARRADARDAAPGPSHQSPARRAERSPHTPDRECHQPEAMATKLAEARREARLELVTELLEVRDRLTRGLAEAQRRLEQPAGLRAHFGQRPVLEALVEGNVLALERLDDTLRRLDVHEIPCPGQAVRPPRDAGRGRGGRVGRRRRGRFSRCSARATSPMAGCSALPRSRSPAACRHDRRARPWLT